MKKCLYYAMAMMLVVMTACGDEHNPIIDPVIDPIIDPVTIPDDNADEPAKHVTVNATLNESTQMWTATIQSSLESKYPGKTIRYVIKPFMKTSYTDSRYKEFQLEWIYGGTDKEFEAYATGNAGSYRATIENPFYNTTIGIDEYGREYELENCWEWWWNLGTDVIMDIELLKEAVDNINQGNGVTADYNIYANVYGELESLFENIPRYSRYVKNYLQIYVEIDGKEYLVKEQEGKLRVPTLKDNPFFDYKDIALEQ